MLSSGLGKAIPQIRDSCPQVYNVMINDPKKRLKDAKDLLEMSLIQQHEYDEIKNEVIKYLALPAASPVVKTRQSEDQVIPILKNYQSGKNVNWLKQNPKIVLGYLMDMLGGNFDVGWLRTFLFLSYEEYVLKILLKGDSNALQHLQQDLSLRYNRDFITKTIVVWRAVLGNDLLKRSAQQDNLKHSEEGPLVFSFLDESPKEAEKVVESAAFLQHNNGLSKHKRNGKALLNVTLQT